MASSRTGKLIVFEGIDGTGKTTQLALLAKVLKDCGLPVVGTREPTDGKYGVKIRSLYRNRESISRQEELDLFLADRRQHVDEILLPGLAAGMIVLCDRYFLSTIAYQGAAGLDPLDILARNDFAPVPDLALLFQVSPEIGIGRIIDGRGDRLNDFERKETLARVSQIFDSLDFPYIKRINADRSVSGIHSSVLDAVECVIPQFTRPKL